LADRSCCLFCFFVFAISVLSLFQKRVYDGFLGLRYDIRVFSIGEKAPSLYIARNVDVEYYLYDDLVLLTCS
jgi:hypothetical protein